MIKVATGEDVTPDEMGGAELHSEKSGEAHYRVATYEAAATARRHFSYLPQSMWSFPAPARHLGRAQYARRSPSHCDPGATECPAQENASWDIRTFIESIVDNDSWLEYHQTFGTSAVVGLARVAGPAGHHCQSTPVLGGSMTAASSSKVTRFLKLANAYHLPVITPWWTSRSPPRRP